MLFQLGPITIDSPDGLNATGTSEEFGGDFAVKPVVGAQQPREFVGEADHKFGLSGQLFPHFWRRAGGGTGLTEIAILRDIASSGEPQILVRGDGTLIGWFLVEKVSQKSSKLGEEGLGREIAWDISLVESPDATSDDGLISLLDGLFE